MVKVLCLGVLFAVYVNLVQNIRDEQDVKNYPDQNQQVECTSQDVKELLRIGADDELIGEICYE